jgi:enoyl-CoA hydratase
MQAYSRFVDLFGPSRLKALLFTARLLSAEEARAAGFVHEIVEPAGIEARVRALAEQIAGFAPITLRVSKEAMRSARLGGPGDNRPGIGLRGRSSRSNVACAIAATC